MNYLERCVLILRKHDVCTVLEVRVIFDRWEQAGN